VIISWLLNVLDFLFLDRRLIADSIRYLAASWP
jgi:hypothetical protein